MFLAHSKVSWLCPRSRRDVTGITAQPKSMLPPCFRFSGWRTIYGQLRKVQWAFSVRKRHQRNNLAFWTQILRTRGSGVRVSPGAPRFSACYNPFVPSPTSPTHRELVASTTDSGVRLDRFIAAACPELSRTRVQELIEAGLVRVDGKAASKGRSASARWGKNHG